VHNKTKRVIRTSSKNLNIKLNSISVSDFWQTNKKSFDRQNIAIPYNYALFEAMMTKSQERNLGLALHTTDEQGQIIACLFVVFDRDCCHALLCGTDPKLRDSNATTLLYWEAIRYAKEKNMLSFDFSGSMLEGVESFYRHFGAEQTPYYLIERRYSKIYSLLRSLKHRT
jgi:lipid II:glycine glycyltransferase (peptidoglycan interpeptide bridge formation enzyme)